jgi:hypothetical protein
MSYLKTRCRSGQKLVRVCMPGFTGI